MDASHVKGAFLKIGEIMSENKDYLIALDQQNGDGDLGLSMDRGFKGINAYLETAEETDLGMLFMKIGAAMNESCASSLGTILSFGMMGIARALKGKTSASVGELALALDTGVSTIMQKANSKPGEKTILDSLCPAIDVLKESAGKSAAEAFSAAKEAAAVGSESTRQMRSVHGRAAYYGDKSIGVLDGGSVVGKLLFEAIFDYVSEI